MELMLSNSTILPLRADLLTQLGILIHLRMLGHNEFKITMLGHLGAIAIDVIALMKRPVDTARYLNKFKTTRIGHLVAVSINGIALICRPVDLAKYLNKDINRLGHLGTVAVNGIALTCRPVDPTQFKITLRDLMHCFQYKSVVGKC